MNELNIGKWSGQGKSGVTRNNSIIMAGEQLGIDPCNCNRVQRKQVMALSEKLYGREFNYEGQFSMHISQLRKLNSAATLQNARNTYNNATQDNRALSGIDLKAQQFVDGIRREANAKIKQELTAFATKLQTLTTEVNRLLAAA